MAGDNDGRAVVIRAQMEPASNLTVWDTYALAALTGLASKSAHNVHRAEVPLQIAERAIELADAMVIERAKHFGEVVT